MNFLNRSDGFEAATEPDLILLDQYLPGDNGHKILSNLRNSENLKHISVIVLTSSERDEDILESYTLGANSYVTKPVGLE
ncbi:MAG: response regulator [Calditrichia bacterium]